MPKLVDARTESSLDTYETPQWLVSEVKAFFGGNIDFDPCTSESNPTGALVARTADDPLDGFDLWPRTAVNAYVNSPYGRVLGDWVNNILWQRSLNKKLEVIQLAPARFGAGWFKDLARGADSFGVFNKRLAFTLSGKPVLDKKGKPCSAQFDAVLAYYGPRETEFRKHFAQHLTFWKLV